MKRHRKRRRRYRSRWREQKDVWSTSKNDSSRQTRLRLRLEKRVLNSPSFDDESVISLVNFESAASLSLTKNNPESITFLSLTISLKEAIREYVLKSESLSQFQPRGLKFKKYTNLYCKIHLLDGTELDSCYDTESDFFLISSKTLRIYYPSAETFKMKDGQKIRCEEIEEKKEFELWTKIPIRNRTIEGNFVIMKKKFHIMTDLLCFIILSTDFMKSFDITPKWGKEEERDVIIIQKNHQVEAQTTKTKFLLTKRIDLFKRRPESRRRQMNVYAKKSMILNHVQKKNVKVRHKSLTSKSYVFELIQKIDLSISSCLLEVHAVVSDDCDAVSMINFEKTPAKIYSGQLLGRLRPFDASKSPAISIAFNYENVFFEKSTETNETINSFEIKTSEEKSTLTSNVSKHWNEKYHVKIIQLLKKHAALFRFGLGKFRNDVKMPIPFKDEFDIMSLKQALYSMSARDKRAMDEMLNPLLEEGRVQKVSLKTVSSTSSSAFVIWKNGKSKVVINLRRINTRLYSDAYSLSKQDIILSSLKDFEIFSSINLTKGFFQQETELKNWWKTTFVTSHRRLEWLTMNSMKLNNILGFFQSRMKKIFDFYLWKFVLVYMNDIIVYFRDSEDHLHHLDEVLRLLEESGVTLTLKKCHFAYLSIKTLKHYVSKLRLSILKKKTEAIRLLRFPRTLRELKTVMKFFNYYRKFVAWYAWKKKPLQQLKTTGFKNDSFKKNARLQWVNRTKLIFEKSSTNPSSRAFTLTKKCFQSWDELKKALIIAFTLTFSDFSLPFKLYVDESKKRRFEIALHQIDKNEVKRSILYLSKCLTDAETRYWTIELKTETLIWILTKLPQYFDDGSFTVVTNHSTLKTTLQTNTSEKRFVKFNEWIMFFAKFESRMTIIHRPGTQHQNADGLSRLLRESDQITLPINVISDEKNFLKKIAKELSTDRVFAKVMKKLKNQIEKTKNNDENPLTEYQVYRLDPKTNLLYVKNKSDSDRICISEKCQKTLLEYEHDQHAHDEIHRIYELLHRSVFMPKMKKLITEYVTSCFVCQLFKSSRQLFYEELQPIPLSSESLFELSFDFIVTLPVSFQGNNCMLTVTNRFSKYVKVVPKKEIMSVEKWNFLYWKHVFKNWGIPIKLINNRDRKFVSKFWKTIFGQCETFLKMTTAYHSFADGQAERTNQTVKTTLRCLLVSEYEEKWKEALSHVKYALNTFENRSTGTSPFEALYDVKPRDALMKIVRKELSNTKMDFLKTKRQIRNDVTNAVHLAQTRMTIFWNEKHRSLELHDKVFLKMAKQKAIDYHLSKSSSLIVKKIDPFSIKKKIKNLVYELKFLRSMKIHLVISVIHLKQAREDDFEKKTTSASSGSVIVNEAPQWVVDRVVEKKIRDDKPEYKIKWKEYDEITFESEEDIIQNISDLIRKFNERKSRKWIQIFWSESGQTKIIHCTA